MMTTATDTRVQPWRSFKSLFVALCKHYVDDASLKFLKEFHSQVRAAPNLLEMYRINQNQDKVHLHLSQDPQGTPWAALHYGATNPSAVAMEPYLSPVPDASEQYYAAVWGTDSFVFKVQGVDLVSKLTAFYAELQAGDALIAPKHFGWEGYSPSSGILLASKRFLDRATAQERQALQSQYESFLSYKARPVVETL